MVWITEGWQGTIFGFQKFCAQVKTEENSSYFLAVALQLNENKTWGTLKCQFHIFLFSSSAIDIAWNRTNDVHCGSIYLVSLIRPQGLQSNKTLEFHFTNTPPEHTVDKLSFCRSQN